MSIINKYYLYLIATVPVSVIFFLIPFEIYSPQRNLWEYNKTLPLFFAGVGSVLMLISFLLFCLSYKKRDELIKKCSLVLFYIGIYILLADIFAPLQSTPLDGWSLKSAEPAYFTYIEASIFITLLLFFIIVNLGKQISIAAYCSLIIWLTSLFYLIYVCIDVSEHSKPRRHVKINNNLPNIYHFVLDELQSDVALAVFKDQRYFKKLDDFTIFPFNSSSYLFTSASFPNYMSGTTFQGDRPFKKWQRSYQENGMLKYLSEKGYKLYVRAPSDDWDYYDISDFKTIHQIMNSELETPLPALSDFMPIWMARLAPNFLSNEALRLGVLLEARFIKAIGYSGRYPRSINDGKEPYASVMMLKNAIKEESNLPSSGRYSYFHGVIPHGPYVMDGQCNYTRIMSTKSALSYYKQAVCGLSLIIQFLEELKRLGRYDNSIIIVHADTGHGLRGLIKVKGNKITTSRDKERSLLNNKVSKYPDWSSDQLLARSMSFLMIKPISEGQAVEITDRRTKLIDIFPTIVSFLDGENASIKSEGFSLFSSASNRGIEDNYYFLYDPRSLEPEIRKIKWDYERVKKHYGQKKLKVKKGSKLHYKQ